MNELMQIVVYQQLKKMRETGDHYMKSGFKEKDVVSITLLATETTSSKVKKLLAKVLKVEKRKKRL